MKLYRFSPIKNENELLDAVRHVHRHCMKLCIASFGKYLPVAGNVGIFCHYPQEYVYLTGIRDALTEPAEVPGLKYYTLKTPIVCATEGVLPEATYTHLYIRTPDIYRAQVGCIDFVMKPEAYEKAREILEQGSVIPGARIFPRADLDMIELYDPEMDALGYASTQETTEKARIKISTS